MNRKLFAMLTAKQEAFAQAYAENPNGAAAAREAGYSASGAKQEASRLLTNPEVAQRTEELRLDILERRAKSAETLEGLLIDLLMDDVKAGSREGQRKTLRLIAQVTGVIGGR